jgi:hypothetical protein
VADDVGDKIAHALARQGIAALPLGSLVLAVAQTFVNDADRNLQEAVKQELLDDVLRLNRKVDELDEKLAAHSKQLDQLGLLRTIAIFEAFLRAFSRTQGNEKREALLNVAARQFDPTLGSLAFRARWFDAVASMDDAQIAAIRMLGGRGSGLVFFEGDWSVRRGREHELIKLSRDGPIDPLETIKLEISADEAVALSDVLVDLARSGYVRAARDAARVRDPADGNWFVLTRRGEAIFRAVDL